MKWVLKKGQEELMKGMLEHEKKSGQQRRLPLFIDEGRNRAHRKGLQRQQKRNTAEIPCESRTTGGEKTDDE